MEHSARIGILALSDPARSGVYEDASGAAIEAALAEILVSPCAKIARIVPDEFESVRDAIVEFIDRERCDFVLTTGGTRPAPRDLTPEATEAACE